MSELRHSIRVASKRTGLSPHVIRIWEKRYAAVQPTRTGTNRRLYSDSEIERLGLLRTATLAGHSIGQIANLSPEKLREISGERGINGAARHAPKSSASAAKCIEDALQTVQQLDSAALEEILERGMIAFGQHGLLEKVIAPLVVSLGEQWRSGTIMAAHEHMASWTIRSFVGRMARPFAAGAAGPCLVVGTPAGQYHEIGAVMVAAAGTDMGWRVTYLGASLPATEIAGTAIQCKARAVALSIVYPDDDSEMPTELQTLRRLLPAEISIIVGGRAAASYRQTLDNIGALQCVDLKQLYHHLEELRRPVAV